MNWIYDEIEREWLRGGALEAAPSEVEAAFSRCEQVLGRDWINRWRGAASGAHPTLGVVTIGRRLASLEGVKGSNVLIEKLKKGEASAWAELHAIHLLKTADPATEVELFPKVRVGEREREPDLRIRRNQGPWVYIEVTQPDVSETENRVAAILDDLSSVIEEVKRPFNFEIFLRREPSNEEIYLALQTIRSFCDEVENGRGELPDGLGVLQIMNSESGTVAPLDHGEDVRPRLWQAKLKLEGDFSRRVSVGVPYSDQRAENFFSSRGSTAATRGAGFGNGRHRKSTGRLLFLGASHTAPVPTHY